MRITGAAWSLFLRASRSWTTRKRLHGPHTRSTTSTNHAWPRDPPWLQTLVPASSSPLPPPPHKNAPTARLRRARLRQAPLTEEGAPTRVRPLILHPSDPEPEILHPKPYALNPQPRTQTPKSESRLLFVGYGVQRRLRKHYSVRPSFLHSLSLSHSLSFSPSLPRIFSFSLSLPPRCPPPMRFAIP